MKRAVGMVTILFWMVTTGAQAAEHWSDKMQREGSAAYRDCTNRYELAMVPFEDALRTMSQHPFMDVMPLQRYAQQVRDMCYLSYKQRGIIALAPDKGPNDPNAIAARNQLQYAKAHGLIP